MIVRQLVKQSGIFEPRKIGLAAGPRPGLELDMLG